MRVHPSVIHQSGSKWQLVVAVALLVFLVTYYIFGGSEESAIAHYESPKMLTVVVVARKLDLLKAIEAEDVKVEKRSVSTLPADVIMDIDLVIGKIPLAPLTPGYPLAFSLLKQSGDEPITVEVPSNQSPQNDSVQEILAAVRPNTVSIVLSFLTVPPGPGNRIALSIQGDNGRSVLVVDEAWVEEVDGNFARILVPSHIALFLEEAKSLGVFSSLIISQSGPSPFAGQAVTNIHNLRSKLSSSGFQNEESGNHTKEQAAQVLTPDNFSSYAWIRGDSHVYAVGSNGKIHTINKAGKIKLLKPYSFTYPGNSVEVP